MSAKNPTLVSLIEISYPLFVIIFTWILFREFQLTPSTLFGAVLILAGVVILTLGERRSG
jgi:drug/metabolite transporter (DMT)-like permease